MSLEKTIEIWETGEVIDYQIIHFLNVIRSSRYFSHYQKNGVPADFLKQAQNYAISCGYDSNLCEKLQQIPTRESLNKKDSIQT
jgi:pantoate kinase